MSNTSNDRVWAALRRAWIERAAKKRGHIGRPEICQALGISRAQASADIERLLADNPACLTLDRSRKRYDWTGGDCLMTEIPAFVEDLIPLPAGFRLVRQPKGGAS